MGLFDKKECALCGGKVNMLTQKKISDGVLCSDCKHKLGCYTSGWKEKNLTQVKQHLEAREKNKQKYAQFNCSASAGSRLEQLNVDFNHRWFIIAGNNTDYKAGNPQVFDFSQLQDFWIEEGFLTETDSDGDGIPDKYDNFDNRQAQSGNGFNSAMQGFNNMMNMNAMNNSMANVPLAAQPFVRRNQTSFSSGVKRVSSIKICLKVNDPFILREISFYIDSSISENNQMELIQAYETAVQVMQLCQQMKQSGTNQSVNNMGMNQPTNNIGMNQGYGQSMQQGYAQNMQQSYAQPMNNMNQGYAAPMGQQNMNQGFQGVSRQQPMQQAGGFCPNCGSQINGTAFCPNCGTRIG